MHFVYIDESVATTISRISKLGKEACGLVIGKSCTEHGVVVKLIQTPLPNQQINAKWVGEHAKELAGMLPGGLFIVGAFIISSTLRMDSTLKSCLYEAYESISKMKMFPFMKKVMFDQSSSWLALHLNLSGNLVKCQIFDMLHKSSPTVVNWKFQSISGGWKHLTSQMSISLPLSYNSLQDLSEDIDSNLARYYQSIMDSYVEINGIFRPGEEALGNLGAGNNDLQIPCDLFLPQRSLVEAEKETEMIKSSGTVLLNGCMQISAHTLLNSTVEQASNALKLDAILSLHQRISLVLQDDKFEFDRDVLFLPKRLFYPDDTCMNPKFEWSDYMMNWEGEEDCVTRIQENLNFKIDQEKLNNNREQFFQLDPEKKFSRSSRHLMSTSKDDQTNFATILFFVIIASITGSYYYVTSLGYKMERKSFRLPTVFTTFLRYINEYIGLKAFVIFTACAFVIRKYFLSADIEQEEIQDEAKIKDQ